MGCLWSGSSRYAFVGGIDMSAVAFFFLLKPWLADNVWSPPPLEPTAADSAWTDPSHASHQVYDIKPGGRHIPVDDSNKQEYIRLLAQFKMVCGLLSASLHTLTYTTRDSLLAIVLLTPPPVPYTHTQRNRPTPSPTSCAPSWAGCTTWSRKSSSPSSPRRSWSSSPAASPRSTSTTCRHVLHVLVLVALGLCCVLHDWPHVKQSS